MSSPKEVIENIRKTRFGIGFNTENLSDDQKAYMQDKKKILEDAARLAGEINSRKPHFIFELIQNAEDNDYEKSKEPKIKFIIKSDALVIQNNEKGFKEENIWALCGIGGTTKEKALGYIGEKGIGFKSVFMVTDEPQIYSNGFQFKFKYDKEKPESVIIPRWIEEIPDFVDSTQTNIVLPLKSGLKGEVSKYLDQIYPSLLLFLRKVKIIEFEDQSEDKHAKIERYDYDTKVEIARNGKKSYWRKVKETLSVPDHIEEEKRRDIHETEMILAFPLGEDGTAKASNEQFVFAFFPIRKYGFKFIIQADFLLTINREDIIIDNQWNKWLRDSIVTVFLNAVDEFKVDRKLRLTFYNYLVFEEVKDEFFLPVVEQIYENLRDTRCVLTETNLWRKPSDVLIGNEEIKNLVSNEDLKEFFGKEYLSSEIKVKKSILRELGVEEFTVDNLTQCLESTEWVRKHSDEWFVALYQYLSRQELFEDLLERLKGLAIIRLENEELTSVNDGVIFFPLDRKGNDYGFESELRIIKRDIIDLAVKYEKKRRKGPVLRRFLKRLGIRDPNPFEIIESHILPVYENNEWIEKDSTVLLGHIRYIKDNIEKYEEESARRLNANRGRLQAERAPLGRLKKLLLIRVHKITEGKEGYDYPGNIYLTKIYGNKNDLRVLFKNINVNFVHSCYVEDILRKFKEEIAFLRNELKGSSKKTTDKEKVERIKEQLKKTKSKKSAAIEEWKKFFLKIGLNEIPRLIYYAGPISRNDEYPTYEERLHPRGFRLKEEIQDWRLSEEFENLLKANSIEKNKILLHILDNNWAKRYSKYLGMRYRCCKYRSGFPYEYSERTLRSSFIRDLKKKIKLPTTQGTLMEPTRIFQDRPQVREILGDSVPYLAVGIENQDLINTLGINAKANVEGVLICLKELAMQKCEEKAKFERLYSFLHKHFEEDIIRREFSNNALIFIPNTEKRFFTSREVLWRDESDIFGKNRGYLEKHYPSLKNFFVERIGISEKPFPKDYADVLLELSRKDEVSSDDEETILKIYEELNYHLNPDNVEEAISEADWWTDFIGKPIFLVESKEFWSNDGDIFINDDPKLYNLFRGKENIAFLRFPEGYHPQRIRFFIDATGLRYLSKSVKTLPSFDVSTCSEHKELTKHLRVYIPYIIRYLRWKEYPRYERLNQNGFLEEVKNLEVYVVGELWVEYTIQVQNANTIPTKALKHCLLHENKLYVSKESLKDMDYMAIELSKIFGEIKGLDDFIISLFEKRTKDKIENLMSAKGIPELPASNKNLLEGPISRTTETEAPPSEPKSEETTLTEEHTEIQIGKGPGHPPSSVESVETIEPQKPWTPVCNPKEANIEVTDYEPQRILSSLTSKGDKEREIPSSQKAPSTSSPPPSKKQDTMSEADKKAIGRIGEELALKCLKEEKGDEYADAQVIDTENGFVIEKDGKRLVQVIWQNKHTDLGVGYDIKLIENYTEYYIEVKSTVTEETDWFDVSKAQWELMQKKGDNFWIYRVYNAGNRKPKLVKIKNPVKLWQKGKLTAYPVRIQI